MAHTKSTLTADARVPVLAALQGLRQELERELETLSSDFRAVKRTEQLIAASENAPSNSSVLTASETPARVLYSSDSLVSTRPGGLRNSIRLLSDCLPARFTAADVFAQLQKQEFKFKGDPAAAVRDALHALSHGKEPTFRIAEQGKGGMRSIYERH